jgi:hypothetical protein
VVEGSDSGQPPSQSMNISDLVGTGRILEGHEIKAGRKTTANQNTHQLSIHE